MKIQDLKDNIKKYQYMEDDTIVDTAVASILANRMMLGEKVWLLIIGESSGGKSQILRPLAMSNPSFIHQVDDLTENTFLSGVKSKEGEESPSFLTNIGKHGIMALSDLTVLMSKGAEAKNAILSQFRMIYDGRMTKRVGNSGKPITWEGYVGVIAAATPSIYRHFEEVADMGERFMYFRMKEYNSDHAVELVLNREKRGVELDNILASQYNEYIEEVGRSVADRKEILKLDDKMKERIIEVATFAEKARAPVTKDYQGRITRIVTPAKPMRVAQQLQSIALGLAAIRLYETGECRYQEADYSIIDWVAYSLPNEESRAALYIIATGDFDLFFTTTHIASHMGLDTDIVKNILQNLAAVGILKRTTGIGSSLVWSYKEERYFNLVRRIANIKHTTTTTSNMEQATDEDDIDTSFENFGL